MRKSIPVKQAMKIPDASPAFDKEYDKVDRLPAWQVTKVKSKKEVIEKAQREGRAVHVATMRDLCHLKNSEFEQQFKNYKKSGGSAGRSKRRSISSHQSQKRRTLENC